MKTWQSTHKRSVLAWSVVAVLLLATAGCTTQLHQHRRGTPAKGPGAVTAVRAGPGGGSGEIVVRWDAVAGATGYRVLRADDVSGPFAVAADFDVTTGQVRAGADDVVNIWSAGYSYLPVWETFAGPDRSAWFEYVELSAATERCFRVVAYNAAGDGPGSHVVCTPSTSPRHHQQPDARHPHGSWWH